MSVYASTHVFVAIGVPFKKSHAHVAVWGNGVVWTSTNGEPSTNSTASANTRQLLRDLRHKLIDATDIVVADVRALPRHLRRVAVGGGSTLWLYRVPAVPAHVGTDLERSRGEVITYAEIGSVIHVSGGFWSA